MLYPINILYSSTSISIITEAAAHPREGRSHQDHHLTRISRRPSDNREALTRCGIGVEVGAGLCLLDSNSTFSPVEMDANGWSFMFPI